MQNFEQNILNLKLAKNLSKFSRDDNIGMSILLILRIHRQMHQNNFIFLQKSHSIKRETITNYKFPSFSNVFRESPCYF